MSSTVKLNELPGKRMNLLKISLFFCSITTDPSFIFLKLIPDREINVQHESKVQQRSQLLFKGTYPLIKPLKLGLLPKEVIPFKGRFVKVQKNKMLVATTETDRIANCLFLKDLLSGVLDLGNKYVPKVMQFQKLDLLITTSRSNNSTISHLFFWALGIQY